MSSEIFYKEQNIPDLSLPAEEEAVDPETAELRLTVPEDAQGERCDFFVASLSGLSRTAVSRLCEQGNVFVMGKAAKKNQKLSSGQELLVILPEPEETELIPQNIPLDIIYEDGDLIVINKPRGMVVHPAPGHPDGTLVNALLYHCGDSLSGIGGEKRPGIVHRIDMDTSGLICVAKNDAAHKGLSEQLKDHSMFRIYEAVCIGKPKEAEFTVSAPIGRHPIDRKRMAINHKNGREATTHVRVLEEYSGYSLIECRLETGRTHQIRVHMESIGHPLAGDMLYGRKKAEKGLEGQCLHARELSFVHPITGDRMSFSCPLPEYFEDFLRKIR